MLTACYLLNRVPNKRIKTTPYELWYKKQPNLSFLRVWGCRVVVRLPDPKRKTLGKKGIDCIFVGYAEHSKAYRLYVIEPNDSVSINSIIESRDAIFDENHFFSIPRPMDIIPNSDKSQTDDHSNDVPSETPEPRRVLRRILEPIMKQCNLGMLLSFWKEAFDDEIGSIMENNTWVLSDAPLGCKPLGCKWIFKRKMKTDGIIDKFKARLVIQGFRQKEGIDYFDTYAPVALITTIRLLLALAAIHNLVIHQMDVKTTFLNGDLEEEVYMKQPEGILCQVVLSSGFLLNQYDKCVYSKFDDSGKGVIICLYVDDMLIFGTDQNQVDKTKKFLSLRFFMKDMGEADVILGIKIKRENKGIAITQSHYIEKILKKFNREYCSPMSTPMDPVEKFKPNTSKGNAIYSIKEDTMAQAKDDVSTTSGIKDSVEQRTSCNFDCDEVPTVQASFMANLSSYGSDVLSEVPHSETYQNDMANKSVQAMSYFEQTPDVDYPDNEITSDSNIISYSQYLLETQQAAVQDTNSSTQQDSMILSVVEQMTDHVANLNKENQKNKMVNESLTAELKRYKERVTIFEQRLNVDLNKQHAAISVIDDEETLIMEEESRSKMLDKQNDPISIEKKIKISPIDYSKLNQIKEDFGKRFVTKKELSIEQAFWLKHSSISETPVTSHTPVRIEALSELPKYSIDKNIFEIEKKELKLEKERLLEHIICQDVMTIVMHFDVKFDNVLPMPNTILDDNIAFDVMKMENDHLWSYLSYIEEYEKNMRLAAELSQMNELSKTCSRLEQWCISLELELQHNEESFQNDKPCKNQGTPEFLEFFLINELKA
ncbi:zinc finger, CCHC-type containing protein [Tanacetum coccineum]